MGEPRPGQGRSGPGLRLGAQASCMRAHPPLLRASFPHPVGQMPPAREGHYDCIFVWHFPVSKVLCTPFYPLHDCGKQAQQVVFWDSPI